MNPAVAARATMTRAHKAPCATHARDVGARAGMPRYLQASALDSSRSLDASTRSAMQTRVGGDLRDVHIHTGPESAAAAQSLGAKAFTIGNHIVFADGRYAPETQSGRGLLAHELAHVAQQRDAGTGRAEGMSRPGDRAEREAERVADAGGRESVRERTPLQVARDPATATVSAADLEKNYHIKIIKGNRDWSESDLENLSAALGMLSAKERTVVSGYEFQRWTTHDARAKADPTFKGKQGVEECGFHELTLGGSAAKAKISMYDGCFDASTTMAGKPVAQFNILHEIGHAAESASARRARKTLDTAQSKYDTAYSAADAANTAYNDANTKRNDLVRQYDAADAAGKKALEPDVKKAIATANALERAAEAAQKKVDPLEKARDAAEKAFDQAQKAPGEAFDKLVEGKDPLTEYSKDSSDEAFAEAFALYKVDPQGLKKANKKLYDWFAANGELTAK